MHHAAEKSSGSQDHGSGGYLVTGTLADSDASIIFDQQVYDHLLAQEEVGFCIHRGLHCPSVAHADRTACASLALRGPCWCRASCTVGLVSGKPHLTTQGIYLFHQMALT